MDWRFRDQKWQRRCRFVAREFNIMEHQPHLRLRLGLEPDFFWWRIAVLDGFSVSGTSRMRFCWWINVKGFWWKSLHGGGVKKLLSRASIGLCENVCQDNEMQQLGFSISYVITCSPWNLKTPCSYPACSGTRAGILCSHVDDLVLCGERGDLEWLVIELKKKFSMQGGEIFPTSDQDPN